MVWMQAACEDTLTQLGSLSQALDSRTALQARKHTNRATLPGSVAAMVNGKAQPMLHPQNAPPRCRCRTCAWRLLEWPRLHAGAGKVLVHQVQQHGRHIVLAALVPVAVDRQPVAQIPRLLPCAPREAPCSAACFPERRARLLEDMCQHWLNAALERFAGHWSCIGVLLSWGQQVQDTKSSEHECCSLQGSRAEEASRGAGRERAVPGKNLSSLGPILRKERYPTMRSSSRPLPKRLSTFFTAGGGPLLFPEGSICTLRGEVSRACTHAMVHQSMQEQAQADQNQLQSTEACMAARYTRSPRGAVQKSPRSSYESHASDELFSAP